MRQQQQRDRAKEVRNRNNYKQATAAVVKTGIPDKDGVYVVKKNGVSSSSRNSPAFAAIIRWVQVAHQDSWVPMPSREL